MKKGLLITILFLILPVVYASDFINYSGDCNSTFYIATGTYNVTVTECAIVEHYSFWDWSYNWVDDENGYITGIYSGAWKLDGTVDADCSYIDEGTDYINVYCSAGNAVNNWTFYHSYVYVEPVYDDTYRYYYFFELEDDASAGSFHTGAATISPVDGNYHTTTSAGMVGWERESRTSDFFAIIFNDTVENSWDYRGTADGNGYGAIAHGRDSEIAADTIFHSSFKVMPQNGTINANLNCFKADRLCNDTIISPCTANWTNTSFTDYYNVSSCWVNDTIETWQNLTQYDYQVTVCDQTNTTFYNKSWFDCDNCTPNLVNTSWTDWYNVTSCHMNNTVHSVMNLTMYDDNYCINETSNVSYFNYSSFACVNACNYVSGNWNITTECSFSNVDYFIDGNLTIEDGGIFNGVNVTLNFNVTNQWIIFVGVADEMKLNLTEYSGVNLK